MQYTEAGPPTTDAAGSCTVSELCGRCTLVRGNPRLWRWFARPSTVAPNGSVRWRVLVSGLLESPAAPASPAGSHPLRDERPPSKSV